jgi:DNA-binding NtrC family response regulator
LDDEVSVRRLIVRILARDGYIIQEASTVDEAMAKARDIARLDVFVTDAHVDGRDASADVEQFRAIHPALAIVLVSGCEPEFERAELLDQLQVKFLAKPFSPAQLRETVELAVRTRFTNSTVMSVAPDAAASSEADRAVSQLRR